MLRQSTQPFGPWQAARTTAAVSCLLAALGTARAEVPDAGALQQMARDFVQPVLNQALPAGATGPLRPEVVIGQLDSRLRLAPCNRIEPHLPPGTQLWGRSRIGLRCVDGPTRWNVYLPVTIKAWGPAWVLRRPVASGATLTEEDAERADIDWAEHRSPVLADPERWVGQQAAFTLQPGQALRQHMVRSTPAFAAGAPVKVSSGGTGFRVVVTGEAMGPGVLGQMARVRLPGGKVVSGLVRDEQTVEIGLRPHF